MGQGSVSPEHIVPAALPECGRCGHPASWHRLDDSLNLDPTDPASSFRCIGYDCEAPGPPSTNRSSVDPNGCDCPDYVLPKGCGPTAADIARGEQLAQQKGWE